MPVEEAQLLERGAGFGSDRGREVRLTRRPLEPVTRPAGLPGSDQPIVAEVRQDVAAAGVDLMATLGAHYLARREPQRAVAQLEEALRRRPDREDLAMRLSAATKRAAYLAGPSS